MSTSTGTAAAQEGRDDLRQHSLGALLSLLSRDARTLLQQQVTLAKTEFSQRVKRLVLGIALLVVAAGIGLFAAAAFTAFAIIGLATLMKTWLAALIVTALLGLTALVLAGVGFSLARRAGRNPLQDTMESVREDIEWIKGQEISGPTSG